MSTPKYNDDGTFTEEYWLAKAEEAEAIAEEMLNKQSKASMRAIAMSYRMLALKARKMTT